MIHQELIFCMEKGLFPESLTHEGIAEALINQFAVSSYLNTIYFADILLLLLLLGFCGGEFCGFFCSYIKYGRLIMLKNSTSQV